MKEQLIHILDQSVCLSRKQMKEYISGTMQREEMHAAEIHLSSCPLCSMAMEGFEAHSDEALAAIASLNSGFLKEHFDNIAPQIHLNSMAPAATLTASNAARKSGHVQPSWRTASIAAGILLLFGALWYVEFGQDGNTDSKHIAMSSPPSAPASTQIAKRNAASPQPGDGPAAAAKNITVATEAPGSGLEPKPTAPDEDYGYDISTASNTAAPALAKLPENEKPAAPAAKAPSPAYAAQGLSDIDAPSSNPESMPARGSAEKNASSQSPDLAVVATQSYSTARPSVHESDAMNAEALKKKEMTAKLAERTAPSPMELGKEAYDKGKYSAALTHYKKQMASGAPQDRAQAKIMAARCYAALGHKPRAQQLLQAVIDEGTGPERRSARRALRELE